MAIPDTLLGRLARDVRGNTLALMAAAMVPLLGFTGSAIDMARLYVVKVRLQQACDTGVLAGRKAMTDTAPLTPLDNTARTQANTFFANNFPTGWYQTTAVSFTPVKSTDGVDSTVANAVSGTARATVPMAVMTFFGMPARELVATCQARFDVADTDVMFVLDTTGSMACTPSAAASCTGAAASYPRGDGTTSYYSQEASGSKMQGLRDAVMLFDETMRANADATTHVRYGFVPYSSAVNVGKIIPAQYLQTSNWTYQSRRLSPTNGGDYDYGAASSVSVAGVPQASCVPQRSPATGFTRTGLTWTDQGYYQARRYYNLSWTSANGGTCSGTQQPLRAMWRYEPVSTAITGLVAGQTVTVPGRLDGLTSQWRGCIEEVNTSNAASFTLAALPNDLDPDLKPSDAANKWRPLWPEVQWLRSGTGAVDRRDDEIDENNRNQNEDFTYRPGSNLDQQQAAACGKAAQQLAVMTRQQVSDYVNHVDFKPMGGTYHDIGMIWGARMLSPDGVFGADTDPWPGRNEPSRNIVFMTDGNMNPQQLVAGQYGIETLDARVAPQGADYATLLARHTARFRIACDAAKRKGMTIYVVAFGASVTVNDDLRYCASPGQAFVASDTPALRTAFQTIAKRVASLRITQ